MKDNLITSHIFPSIEDIHIPKEEHMFHRLMTYVRVKRQGQYYFVACVEQYEINAESTLQTGKAYADFFKSFVNKCYTLQHLWCLDTDMSRLSEADVMVKCTINIEEESRLKLLNKFPSYFGGFNRIETFL
tara:strand:- start:31097 stop:31489 length:393 start_codon:yes stop_codon:yes gene_type:complete